MSIVEFQQVNLTYGEKVVLKDFSLKVSKGEKILIVGKSGIGKSTLFRLLLGYDEKDGGKIFLNGQQIEKLEIYKARQLFAYVNQDVTLRSGMVKSVLEDIGKFSGNQYTGNLDLELAKYFEFDLGLLEKEMEELSGGERQRLGILIAIMLERPVFLLDEVTSALDKDLKQRVVDYFDQTDKTVIAISHDPQWQMAHQFRKVDLK